MAGLETGSMVLKHTHPYSLEELHDLDTNHISEGLLAFQRQPIIATSPLTILQTQQRSSAYKNQFRC